MNSRVSFFEQTLKQEAEARGDQETDSGEEEEGTPLEDFFREVWSVLETKI